MFHVIFVDISNKELLEQHLGDYATWMPYGFGEKGMLGLYPTNEHSEEEIIGQLKKFNIPYYTEVTEAVVLAESGNDQADESYKGIFIDRKTGDFKILTGRFPDKKAMINKYGTLGKDYIARKVFEKPVFDWILNNAKSSLDSYLMFSTAFSKWRDNSILDKYYIKLINDMPQLFKNIRAQDKIGGEHTKHKKQADESIDMQEAEYVGNNDDVVREMLYFVAYGEDGKVLVDYTNRVKIPYTANSYNYESVELYDWLQKVVDQTEEDTGEKVAAVAVKKRPKDPSPKLYTRAQIEKGYTKDVGNIWNDDNTFDKTLNNPDSEKLTTLIFCRDDEGRRVVMNPYPTYINHVIEKGKGIDDRQVWITALQTLNTAGKMNPTDEVFIIDPADGKEKVANRRSVETNVHNMEPNQSKPILTKSGKISHPVWSSYKLSSDNTFKGALNAYNKSRETVTKNLIKQEPIDREAHLKRLGRPDENYRPTTYGAIKRNLEKTPRDGIRAWRHFESAEEQKEYEMALREEVQRLIEASGVYDIPEFDLTDPNVNNTVRFIVKNAFGKDDVEEVAISKPAGADVELEDLMGSEIDAAAEKIKARNPGKKVYVQINDEEPTEYIDIAE